MRRLLFLATACFAITSASFAAAPKAPSASLEGVPSGKYLLDKSHANVIFFVSHLGFSTYTGRFNNLDATMIFNASAPENSAVKVTIDTASVDTNNKKLEDKLRDEKWFNVAAFKNASFTSTSIEKLSGTKGKIVGDLSIRGITRPITLDVTFNAAGMNPFVGRPTLGFSATGAFKRSDYGMKEYLPAVGDMIDLRIEAEFNQAVDE